MPSMVALSTLALLLTAANGLVPTAHKARATPRAASDSRTGSADVDAAADATLRSLRARLSELDAARRAPRKFRVNTMHGFLNVHTDAGDPYRLDNVVGRLPHGEVVLALAANDGGDWIAHDHGGWSVREHDGFEWLVPVDDDAST